MVCEVLTLFIAGGSGLQTPFWQRTDMHIHYVTKIATSTANVMELDGVRCP